MGLLDKAFGKDDKKNTIYLTYDKLAEMIKKEFISANNDAAYLKKLKKVIKSGTDMIESPSGKHILYVGMDKNFIDIMALFAPKKPVSILANDSDDKYELDNVKNYKKLRDAVIADIESAK